MSPVSAGLAATIREWFASGDLKTAIEQTAHIDTSKMAKPRKRSSSSKKGSHEGSGDSATAVAEPPSHGEGESSGMESMERQDAVVAEATTEAVVEDTERASAVETPTVADEAVATSEQRC